MGSIKRTHRYRLLAQSSEVDETLFGSCKNLDKNTVEVITKDLFRILRIQKKDPPERSILLPEEQFERITLAPQCFTKEQEEALMEAYQKRKQEKIKAAEKMKAQMKEIDLHCKKNQALTKLELETKDRAQRLVERASILRLEEDDEMKRFNRVILDAKCRAALDTQIQEKRQIQAELLKEEKRLDAMMEVERRRAVEAQEKIDELRRHQRVIGNLQLHDQCQKRLSDKVREKEVERYERQLIQQKEEEEKVKDPKIEKKKNDRLCIQEIRRINMEAAQAKEQRREEEKLEDKRYLDYILDKEKREIEREAEKRRLKKERDVVRQRTEQEKPKDTRAEQIEKRVQREEESISREWRKTQRDLVAKKMRVRAELRENNAEQLRCREQLLTIEIARRKAEFEQALKVQQEAAIKHREKEEKQREEARRHGELVLHQIREQKLSASANCTDMVHLRDQLTEKARQRRVQLDALKKKKLQELKDMGLSEIYYSDVERKAQISIP